MAAPLDRTWYNALVDDDGGGTTGTVWNKAQVDGLLDTVDASLVTIVDRSGTPAGTQLARFADPDTITGSAIATLEPTQAALILTGSYPSLTLQDPAALAGDQIVRLVNIGNVFYIIGQDTLLSLSRTGLLTVVGGVSLLNGALTFPSTPVPHAGDTTLDDYRKKPWTPTPTGGSGGSGVTYGYREGTYTKIGRSVVAQGRLSFTAAGTMLAPGFYITGLPVPCGAIPGAVIFSACEALAFPFSWIGGSVMPNQIHFQCKYVGGAGANGIDNWPHNALTNASYLEFTAFYQAAG